MIQASYPFGWNPRAFLPLLVLDVSGMFCVSERTLRSPIILKRESLISTSLFYHPNSSGGSSLSGSINHRGKTSLTDGHGSCQRALRTTFLVWVGVWGRGKVFIGLIRPRHCYPCYNAICINSSWLLSRILWCKASESSKVWVRGNWGPFSWCFQCLHESFPKPWIS